MATTKEIPVIETVTYDEGRRKFNTISILDNKTKIMPESIDGGLWFSVVKDGKLERKINGRYVRDVTFK